MFACATQNIASCSKVSHEHRKKKKSTSISNGNIFSSQQTAHAHLHIRRLLRRILLGMRIFALRSLLHTSSKCFESHKEINISIALKRENKERHLLTLLWVGYSLLHDNQHQLMGSASTCYFCNSGADIAALGMEHIECAWDELDWLHTVRARQYLDCTRSKGM